MAKVVSCAYHAGTNSTLAACKTPVQVCCCPSLTTCSTPWLVRRRRTCPICKGDVVRSMAHGSSNERRREGENRSDDVQARAGETANESPSAAIPIPRLLDEDGEDVERGGDSSATLTGSTNDRRSGWRSLASLSISALSGDTAVWRQSPADRNR